MEEVRPDRVDVVTDHVTHILEVLGELNNPAESIQILAVASVFVICNSVTSAKDADEVHMRFVNIIDQALKRAEKIGATMWTKGSVH